jgi:cell division protein FtsA
MVRILGWFGVCPSPGIRKGVVINIESTAAAIRKAVEQAELMAGCEVRSVYASVSGEYIKGSNSKGINVIRNSEVSKDDVERVIAAAKTVAISMDREIIHILPQKFIIDDVDGIRDPLGMSGFRLEARVHIVTGAVACVQNTIKSCNRTNLDVAGIVLEQFAASEAVLSDEEKELCVALVDIGGETTDIAIFIDGAIAHTSVLSLGGNEITNEIAMGLHISLAEAEKIKQNYGCCLPSLVSKDETIVLPVVVGQNPRFLSRLILAETLERRVQEIFDLVKRELIKSGYGDFLISGVVITGGSSILEGMPELAEQVLNLRVRCGTPVNIGGLIDTVNSPDYATGVGLIVYGRKNDREEYFPALSGTGARDGSLFQRASRRMMDWGQRIFF